MEKVGLLFWIHTDPRKFIGEISAKYIGANPAFSPQLIPMTNRPAIIISYDPYIFETPVKKCLIITGRIKHFFGARLRYQGKREAYVGPGDLSLFLKDFLFTTQVLVFE